MTREEALQFINEKIKNQNLIKHMLATEAIMSALAKKFNQDEKKWGLAGLLHDADSESFKDAKEHGLLTADWLKDKVDEDIRHACAAHNEANGTARESLLDYAIFAADPLTGLIVAATLVLPSKKLSDLTVESLLKRFKEPRFAAGANREVIASCADVKGLNMSLEEFVKIGLEAMQGISKELGL